MRTRRNPFLRSNPNGTAPRGRHRERVERSYWNKRQAVLAFITAPVLAIGISVGGLALPAHADDATPPPTSAPSSTDASSPAPGDTPSSTPSDTSSSSAAPSPSPSPSPSDTQSSTPTDTPSSPSPSPSPTDTQLKTQSLLASPQDVTPFVETTCSPASNVACLKVNKTVVNTGGGTAGPSDWTFAVQLQTRSSGNWGNTGAPVTFNAGDSKALTATVAGSSNGSTRYVVSENAGPANYNQTSATCDSSQSPTGVRLGNNATVTCTFTNTYVAPTFATIKVNAGGIRTGASSVSGLNSGKYQAVPVSGSPAGGPFTCDMSGGTCNITVPSGFAWKVSALTAATDYYLNPNLDSGSSSTGTSYPYVFQTDTLGANSTVTVPGASLTGVYKDNGNPTQKFSGMLAQSYNNPPVAQKCGLNIALVLDQSGSMSQSGKQAALKTAATDAINGLVGTPSSVGIYTFASKADSAGHVGSTSTVTSASAQPLINFISNLGTPANSTNWDAGLGQVPANYDLVILLTDGNPTTFGDGSVDGSNSEFAYAEQGIFSANRIKASLGERLVTIGIGVDGGDDNIRALSGTVQGNPSDPKPTDDYYLASNTDFGNVLKTLATGACNNSVTIQKQIEDASGNIIDNSPLSNGWNYSGSISSGTLGSFDATAPNNNNNGFTSAAVGIDVGATPTISLTEDLQSGYTFDRAKSTCKVGTDTVSTSGSGTTLSFTGAANVPISCIFVNKVAQTYGTFSITKSVTGSGAGLVGSGASFSGTYSYPAGSGFPEGSGTWSTTNGGTYTSGNIPTGAIVTLTENAPTPVTNGTWGTPVWTPAPPGNVITIGNGTKVAVNLNNPITLDQGTFTVKKTVDGTGAGAVSGSTQFTVDWSYPGKTGVYSGDSGTITLTKGQTSAAVSAPVGAQVTLSEDTPANIPGVTWGPTGVFSPASPITISTKNTNVAVTVTNTATLNQGKFSVQKLISGDTGLVPGNTQFTVHYTYDAGNGYPAGSGDVTVTPSGGAVTSGAIPQGAVVHLTEPTLPNIPNGTWGTPSFSQNDFTIGNDTTVAVTLTNPITVLKGGFDLTKVVSGTGAAVVPDGTSFKVDYGWAAGPNNSFPSGSGTVTITKGGGAVAVSNVPVGAVVSFSEQTPPTFTGVSFAGVTFNPVTATITSSTTVVHVTVTNTYNLNYGTFSVKKVITGDTGLVPSSTAFKVDYSWPAGNGFDAGSGTLTVKADGVLVASDPIPQGAVVTYTEETPPAVPNGTWGTPSFSPTSVTIGNGDTVNVTLTNPISSITGAFDVTKVIAGTGASAVPTGTSFTVNYSWPADPNGKFQGGGGHLTVNSGGPAVGVSNVPVGAQVEFTEDAAPTFTGVTWDGVSFGTNPITITSATQTVHVTATNTYNLNTGSFSITKKVTGSGAYLVDSGMVFTVHYQYTGGYAGQPGTGQLALLNGIAQTVSNLPQGSVVTFTEDTPGTVVGGTWGAATFDPNSVTIGNGGDPVAVTLTNPITEIAPTLQLKKVVQDDVVPNTNWILTGTGSGSATVTNPDGGNTAVTTVKTGVDYALSEAPKGGFSGAGEFTAGKWTCVDGSGRSVTVTQGATGSGNATLTGLLAGQSVVCTIINTHTAQGVDMSKTVVSTTQNADGTWTIVYNVTVNNLSSVVATTYNLGDTLNYGTGITVNNASWSGPTSGTFSGTSAQLAKGQSVAAGGVDTYTVTANATVTGSAWTGGTTTCTNNGGGFFNSAHVVSGPTDITKDACSEPATLTVTKSANGDPTWDPATGHWTIAYTVTVENNYDQQQYYQLTDTPEFGSGVTLAGDPTVTKNGSTIAWNGGALAPSGTPIAAAGQTPVKDVYVITAVVDVSGITSGTRTTCAGPDSGLYNLASLTTGTVTYTDDACKDIPTPTITHTKAVVPGSVAQAANGTWSIQYTITVDNTGKVPGVYSLADTLRYGAGISTAAASWSGQTSGNWSGLPGNVTAQLASAMPIAAGALQTYTVSVSGITIPAGVIGSNAGECPAPGSTSTGGLNNDAGLTVNGVTTDKADCASPTNPMISKHFVSAVQHSDDADKWDVSYTVTVNNASGTNTNYYTLSDTPEFSSGVSVDSVTVDGAPGSISGGVVPIVTTPTAIAAGATKTYTLVFTVTVGNEVGNAKCTGEPGNGFFNSATMTVGADKPVGTDCGPIENKVNPDVVKTVKSNVQNPDGTWTIIYDLTVTQPAKGSTNPDGLSGKYDLNDTLDFGAGLTINSAKWALNGGSSNNWGAFDGTESLATGRTIAAGVTDTYQVTVNADVTQKAVDDDTAICDSDTDGPSGFLNTATMTASGKDSNVEACASPALPWVNKTLNSSVQNPDGSWTLSYDLQVGNDDPSTPVHATLTDDGSLPSNVTPVGDWKATAVGSSPAPVDSSWKDGLTGTLFNGTLPANTTYEYTVTITVNVTSQASEPQECGDDTGTVIDNMGIVTSGKITGSDEACGVVHYYDLGIAKSFTLSGGEKAVNSGTNDPINYKLIVTNNGEDVSGATVTDPMPAGVTLDVSSISPVSGWDTSGSTSTEFVAVYQGTYAAGSTDTFTFTGTVGTLSRPDGKPYPDIVNQACVAITGYNPPPDTQMRTMAVSDGPQEFDANPANDCSTVKTPVNTPAPPAPPAAGGLAGTGSDVLPYLGAAGALVVLGLALMGWLWRRRREDGELG